MDLNPAWSPPLLLLLAPQLFLRYLALRVVMCTRNMAQGVTFSKRKSLCTNVVFFCCYLQLSLLIVTFPKCLLCRFYHKPFLAPFSTDLATYLRRFNSLHGFLCGCPIWLPLLTLCIHQTRSIPQPMS